MKNVSSALSSLKREIKDFEERFETGKNRLVVCGSDCYCRQAGNHKITRSKYHKDCISMKKKPAASVKKCELSCHRHSRSLDRKEIFTLENAHVEVSVKNSTKDLKCTSTANPKCVVEVEQNECRQKRVKSSPAKLVQMVDSGTDPIMIVEPKSEPKQSWSNLLGKGSYDQDAKMHRSRSPLRYPKKVSAQGSSLKNIKTAYKSTSEAGPHSSSSETYFFNSEGLRNRAIIVCDHAVQCSNSNAKGSVVNSTSGFSLYNPLNALQFLMGELKDYGKKSNGDKDGGSLTSIISDMDFALRKLTFQADSAHGKAKSCPPKNPSANSLFSKGMSGSSSERTSQRAEKLQKKLEDTCLHLQITCRQLEEASDKLRTEKDQVTEKFFEKGRELESSLKRELEYQNKLREASRAAQTMSLKLDQYTKSLEEMSAHLKRLKEENKSLQLAEEMKLNLHSQLMEASRENDRLNTEIQLMLLEREKNKVLISIKEQEVAKLKSELLSIGGLVSEKRISSTTMGGGEVTGGMLSSTLESAPSSHDRELVSSSPEGSSPSKSWAALSSIISGGRGLPPARPRHHPLPRPHTMVGSTPGLPPPPPPVRRPHTSSESQTSASLPQKPPIESIRNLKNELRELFAQMKRQTELSEISLPELSHETWTNATDSSDGYVSISISDMSGTNTT